MKAPTTADSPPRLPRQIQELRHSSRLLVRALGFMRSRMEGTDCTPAQCHVLTELSARGPMTTGELATALEVDKSTASRSVGGLLNTGLIESVPDPEDRRTRPVRLSTAGLARVAELHAVADAQVGGALELLDPAERATVLRGISLYERALHRAKALAEVAVRGVEPGDDGALARIIRSVMTEFGAVGCGFSIEDREVDEMHATYTVARAAYFVAERDGRVIAGGGIAPLMGSESGDICELRKMYALTEARGLGVGRRILERCLAAAREAGFRRCYLETLRHMDRARALYEKFGFERLTGPMGDTGHHRCDDWFLLEL